MHFLIWKLPLTGPTYKEESHIIHRQHKEKLFIPLSDKEVRSSVEIRFHSWASNDSILPITESLALYWSSFVFSLSMRIVNFILSSLDSQFHTLDGSSFSSLREVGLRLESYPALQRSTCQEACEREKRKHDLEKTKKYYTTPSYERRLQSVQYSYPIRPRREKRNKGWAIFSYINSIKSFEAT